MTKAFQTNYRQGFLAHDPEGNGVAFTIDRAIEQYQEERQYNWDDEVEQALDPEEIGKHAVRDYDQSLFGARTWVSRKGNTGKR